MKKILVIDDETGILELMRTYLSRKGYEVLTEDNGEDGITALRGDSSIGLVILDIRMPGVDGIELFPRIRVEYPATPVIILTGSMGEEVRDLGADGVFMKPVDMEELLGKIRELAG